MAAKMDKQGFFSWLNFFRNAEVVIGNGSVEWTLASGWYDNVAKQARVTLKRRVTASYGDYTKKTTVDAERVRLAKHETEA